MRIAYLINEIDVMGGTHKQLLKLLDYTDRCGYDFIVLTRHLDFTKTYPLFRKFKSKIYVYDELYTPSIINIFYLRRYLKPFYRKHRIHLKSMLRNCDIINIHDNGWDDVLDSFKRKKVIWQINDLPSCFAVGASKHTICEEDIIEQRQILSKMQYVDDITVNVRKNAERVKSCLNRDAHVFYCGIEPVNIKKNIIDTFNRFNDNRINILTSGHFLKYRNYETQISVVKALINKGIDTHLHIMGSFIDCEYYDKINSMIIESNLENNIIIEGQVSKERYQELHRQADVFMFINIDQSWGLAVFEAMSCGLPVIVSESVGATEILDNGKNALYVNPIDIDAIVDQMLRLMNDKDYYSFISGNASKFHDSWSWDEAYCSKMMTLFLDESISQRRS